MVKSGEALINVYSAISVNAAHVENTMFNHSMDFIQWIVGNQAQDIIENFGQEDYNQSLFNPAAGIVQSKSPIDIYNWINQSAFFDFEGVFYECPPSWRQGDFGLYPLMNDATVFDALDCVTQIIQKERVRRHSHDSFD